MNPNHKVLAYNTSTNKLIDKYESISRAIVRLGLKNKNAYQLVNKTNNDGSPAVTFSRYKNVYVYLKTEL